MSSLFGGLMLSLLAIAPSPEQAAERAPELDDFLARAQSHLAEREYQASENGKGLQAPNRAHDLRTYFDATGIRVHDRMAGEDGELLRLSLAGVGRGDALASVAPGDEVVARENRVEIVRPGLVEWFVNGPEGLEQGFDLSERPVGQGKLRLELALSGARVKPSGEALIFETASGRRLEYGKLAAFDARGAPLPAEFVLADAGRVALEVDDAGARYPITIDPLLTETADGRLEGDQVDARLGFSVASAGDVNGDGFDDVIVGADLFDGGQPDEGAAFVFLGGPGGVSDAGHASAQTRIEGDQANALLGTSVASAGDVNGDGYEDVIVGAHVFDGLQVSGGAAFVFLGSATGVADGTPATAHAMLDGNQADASFGFAVAGAGDVNGDGYGDVIVGAIYYDAGQLDEGAAFVFLGSASGVADATPATAHARIEGNQVQAFLGVDVASAGDLNGDGYGDLIVGAPQYDAGQIGEGAAFVFLGSAGGVGNGTPATAHAQLEGDQTGAGFGSAVESAGDVNGDGYGDVVVGAPTYDVVFTDAGAAFLFLGGASGLADGNPTTAHAQLESDQASASMGTDVASAGDVNGDGFGDVLVGASDFDDGQNDEGAVFVFLGSAGGVADGNPTTAYAQLESNQAGSDFGSAVAGAGDVNGDGYGDVIVGAFRYDDGQIGEGAAFVYLGGSIGIRDGGVASAATRFESNQASALFGGGVASAGDVNGDGFDDLVVGAASYDNGQSNEGAAFLFLGREGGPINAIPVSAHAMLEGNQVDASFGFEVAGAGDVNGDGYGDVIVGALGFDNGQVDEGAAFVFLGSAAGIASGGPATAHARLESDQATAGFGVDVAAAGDVNGDGYGDVIVGAHTYDAGQADEGAAFVFLGSAAGIANGTPANAHARLESDQGASRFGRSVSSTGDLNGDGYADVIVGADTYDSGQLDEGAAFLFLGSAAGIANASPATAHARIESDQAGAALGFAVSGAGDVNGDGYADVITGAYAYDNPESNEGAAFAFLGGPSGIPNGSPANASDLLESNQADAFFGGSLAGAGDVNGDGYADVIVGAYFYDLGQSGEGTALVFLGSANGVVGANPATAHAQLQSDQINAVLGSAVASAGDVNGDGFADVIVGASQFDAPQVDEGAAFVWQGGGDIDGRLVKPRQRRGDGSGIAVAPWGSAISGSSFVAELRASHPSGTGRVKAQFEACPPGIAMGDPGCTKATTPTWLAVNGTTPEVSIAHTFTGLSGNTLYRWRGRVLHAPSTGTPVSKPDHGPWRRIGGQAVEADIRLPEPDALVMLVAGGGLVAGLARRRLARGGRRSGR